MNCIWVVPRQQVSCYGDHYCPSWMAEYCKSKSTQVLYHQLNPAVRHICRLCVGTCLVCVPLAHGAPEEALAAVAGGGAVVLPRRTVAADRAVLDRAHAEPDIVAAEMALALGGIHGTLH